MQIPNKSAKGLNLRKWLVETLDALIECVTWMRIRPGPGISVRETPAGTVVSLSGQAGHPQTAAPAALVRAGEGVRIDNGTATSVYVPGTTAAAVPVNGATFTCLLEGSTSGTGGIGFPDWGMSAHNAGVDSGLDIGNAAMELSPNDVSVVLAADAWIYAFAEFEAAVVNERRASAHVVVNGCSFKVASVYSRPDSDTLAGAGGGIVIPALAGSTVSFIVQVGQNPADFIHREGCVVYYV